MRLSENFKLVFTKVRGLEMAMMYSPRYQGDLDGLCGVYAVVNALTHSVFASPAEAYELGDEVFREACRSIPRGAWPDVVWEGTLFEDVVKMVRRCLKNLPRLDELKMTMPFKKDVPKTDKEYWQRFDDLFENEGFSACAIIGLTRHRHWIVARRHQSRRMLFLDSTAGGPVEIKNRSSLYAGMRHPSQKVWLIDRAELIFVRNTLDDLQN